MHFCHQVSKRPVVGKSMTCLPYQDKREPGVRERDKTQTGEGLDGEKASTKAHEKSGEAEEENPERKRVLPRSAADTSCHHNF
jgi:hypothetical protein